MQALRLPIASKKLIRIKSGDLREDIRPVNKFYISRLKYDIWNPKPFEKIEYYSGGDIFTVNIESIKVVGETYVINVNTDH